ncbi:MAG: glucose dehydrogenase [Caulobacteraceae bacterium]|nr:glucose dehydrogenase [Caulobacteraceae bacterium]
MDETPNTSPPTWSARIMGGLLVLIGLALLAPGAWLLSLGGSAYYVAAGALLVVTGVLLWRANPLSQAAFSLFMAGTVAWAIWESGFDGWALAPRVLIPMALGVYFLLPAWRRTTAAAGRRGYPALWTGLALLLTVGVAIPRGQAVEAAAPLTGVTTKAPAPGDGEWTEYGRDKAGSRFSPLTQITPGNVHRLERAWTYRTGLGPTSLPTFEATPLKIRDRLYFCTSDNDVIALDAETGREAWRYRARADMKGVKSGACRGVAYFRADRPEGPCRERLFTATADRRLIAIDLADGQPCRDFGAGGVADLGAGMGPIEAGYYHVTSAPQVVAGKVVLGGKISDSQYIGEPSGVVRAFDAVTGQLAWAWDVGRPDRQGLPAQGETYTLGTPNSWAPLSADEALGLVYLPMGNPTPDYYGGQRRPYEEKYASALVALDVATGAVRWSFQTTHHDLWDYDIPAQPTLVDLPGGVKAVLVATKRGEVFLLDRLTGRPIAPVEERAVPGGGVPGERVAPTQPFSNLPSFAGARPTEQRMWGISPFDQLYCRIKFRQARFDGTLTPLGTERPTLVWPGFMGGFEWGGVAVDPERGLMLANTNDVSNYDRLLTRAEARARGVDKSGGFNRSGWYAPQRGTPYAVHIKPFLSPLGVPCTQPPFGTISAVDLRTRKLVWTRSFGTTAGSGPFGIAIRLPLPMGVPSVGGAVTTRGGVAFIGASQDGQLRAYETATGRELWKTTLPAGGQANPMTYWSDKSARQFVVIAAGGQAGLRTRMGDYVVAYALPRGGAQPQPRP